MINIVGKTFCDFRKRSFYIDRQLMCSCLVLFFNLKGYGWVSLSIGEGATDWNQLKGEPEFLSLDKVKDEFAYPISGVEQLEKYRGEKVLAVAEYRLNESADFCIGVYFKCENNSFSIIEEDNCLCCIDGVAEELLPVSSLLL